MTNRAGINIEEEVRRRRGVASEGQAWDSLPWDVIFRSGEGYALDGANLERWTSVKGANYAEQLVGASQPVIDGNNDPDFELDNFMNLNTPLAFTGAFSIFFVSSVASTGNTHILYKADGTDEVRVKNTEALDIMINSSALAGIDTITLGVPFVGGFYREPTTNNVYGRLSGGGGWALFGVLAGTLNIESIGRATSQSAEIQKEICAGGFFNSQAELNTVFSGLAALYGIAE